VLSHKRSPSTSITIIYSWSNRKRGYLQSGSAGLDANRKTACGPPSGWCITPFKAADPRECLPHSAMRTARRKPTAAKLRSWRVVIMRSRGEYLGSVEAPDREGAEAVAIKQFALDDDQRRRLLIRERD
jgi:hypothetical protein